MADNVATFEPAHARETQTEEKPVNIAGERIKSTIERVERLEEEKKALAEDIKEVYGEAKGFGLDPKILRRIIKLRKMEPEKRQEEDELLTLYMSAIGMY